MMRNSFVAIGLLFVVFGISNAAPRGPCSEELKATADSAFGQMVLYGELGTSWPRNPVELEQLCKKFKPNEVVVRKYARTCLSGLPQTVIGMVLKGTGKMFKQFCGPNADSKALFDHSKCGNSDPSHDHACMHKYVQMSKNALSLDEVERMGGGCCAFNEFEGCVINRMRKEPKCTKEAITFFKGQIKAIAGDALDLVCTEYHKKPEQCNSLFKKMKKKNMVGKSLLLPLTETMESLSS